MNEALSRVIRNRTGHEVDTCLKLEEAFEAVRSSAYDVVFLDVRMPDGDGIKALPIFRDSPSKPEIIVLTGEPDKFGAKQAIECGAWDYLVKPFDIPSMLKPLEQAIKYRTEKIKSFDARDLNLEGLVGSGFQMKKCLEKVALAAKSEANVLITGATGTGKELFAKTIHRNSERAGNDFQVVDCTVIPETLAESILFGHEKGSFTDAVAQKEGIVQKAHKGTLFLDEIGDLPWNIQKKFLRFLEERTYRRIGGKEEIKCDFRLVAATNRDLGKMVENGEFRKDLLFRLKGIDLEIPPLKERKEDIGPLTNFYLEKLREKYDIEKKRLSDTFLKCLSSYSWPGNVRQLIDALKHALNAAEGAANLFPNHLPVEIRIETAQSGLETKAENEIASEDFASEVKIPNWKAYRARELARVEEAYLRKLMEAAGKDIQKAMDISGLSRSRLYGLLARYKIL